MILVLELIFLGAITAFVSFFLYRSLRYGETPESRSRTTDPFFWFATFPLSWLVQWQEFGGSTPC